MKISFGKHEFIPGKDIGDRTQKFVDDAFIKGEREVPRKQGDYKIATEFIPDDMCEDWGINKDSDINPYELSSNYNDIGQLREDDTGTEYEDDHNESEDDVAQNEALTALELQQAIEDEKDSIYSRQEQEYGQFTDDMSDAEGEVDEQAVFDVRAIKKTQQAALSKDEKRTREHANLGKHPEKPKYKDVSRVDKATIHSAVDELRAQTLAHESEIFDAFEQESFEQESPEQALLRAKEDLREHYFKKDNQIQRYPTLKEK